MAKILGVHSVYPTSSMIRLNTGNGYGATNTAIRRFANITESLGSAITYNDSSTLGASFTINETGEYTISFTDVVGGINEIVGITKNTTQPTIGPDTLSNPSEMLAISAATAANSPATASWSGRLSQGDIIRPHNNKSTSANNGKTQFTISKEPKVNI